MSRLPMPDLISEVDERTNISVSTAFKAKELSLMIPYPFRRSRLLDSVDLRRLILRIYKRISLVDGYRKPGDTEPW